MVMFTGKFERIGKPTGRRQYRHSWFGKVVLVLEFQVEEVDTNPYKNIPPVVLDKTVWRDATWAQAGTGLWPVSAEFESIAPKVVDIKEPLTGMRRYRRSYFGKKVVLQVEVAVKEKGGIGVDTNWKIDTRWRDATMNDLRECRNLGEGRYQRIGCSGPHDAILEQTYDK